MKKYKNKNISLCSKSFQQYIGHCKSYTVSEGGICCWLRKIVKNLGMLAKSSDDLLDSKFLAVNVVFEFLYKSLRYEVENLRLIEHEEKNFKHERLVVIQICNGMAVNTIMLENVL